MNTSKNEKTVNDDRQIEENNEHKCLQPSNNIKVMETSFSKLNLDEKNKEINKTSLLVKPKPNDRWPQILLHQLNFYFSPPTCLTITKLEEELNLLFKQFFLCIKIQTERKEQVLLENPHLLPKLDGLQTTSLSQLIVQYMWEIYRRKDNQLEFLLPIIAFIEWARNSTFDCTASMQIMLCRLYGIFGSVDRIKEMEKEIQLKFIQKDSLAFLRFFVHYQFGRFKEANIYYTDLGVMYDMNERETNECLVNAYKNNSFNHIQRLFEFSEKANNSIFSIGADILNRNLTSCFTPLDEIKSSKGGGEGGLSNYLIGDEIKHPIDWNKLSDNRDFSVFPSIIPDNLIKQIAEYSFNQMKHFFMFKNALLTAIGSIGSCLLEDRIANLELVIVQCRSPLDKDFENEQIFENYINIKLNQLLLPTNKLFNLPILLLEIALDIQKQLKEEEKGKNKILILKHLPDEKNNFSNNLNNLEKFYKIKEELNWNYFVELIPKLAIVIEILALSLIACKLLISTTSADYSNQNNENSTSKTELLKKSDKLINNSTLISSLRARVIQPISGSIKRIKLFLTKNVDINRMSQDENFNKKLNEVMEIIPESIRQPINKLMTEQILKWLNENINCSVNEMNQTCDFLLAKFC